MRKILFLTILIIIFNGCLVSANSSNYLLKNNQSLNNYVTFYIDDNADSGWYDETHFKTIMQGIENASNGDTVFVYNGIYYERIIIDKSINLVGEDKYNTFIDGTYITDDGSFFGLSIIRITHTSYVLVTGFTIQNVLQQTLSVDAGIYIYQTSHYINISNNIIKNIHEVGIFFEGSKHIISDNLIMDSGTGFSSISVDYFPDVNSIITRNTIKNMHYEGISLWYSNYNTISWNNIKNCTQGITLLQSRYNLIKRNNITNNIEGIFLSKSRRNKFYENNFIENGNTTYVEFNGWSFFNKWRRNYWDNQIIHILPKILVGRFGVLPIPWFNFDLHPARKPYEI